MSSKSRAALATYKETPQRSEMTTRDCRAWASSSRSKHKACVAGQRWIYWPRLAEARGSPRHDLALRGAA